MPSLIYIFVIFRHPISSDQTRPFLYPLQSFAYLLIVILLNTIFLSFSGDDAFDAPLLSPLGRADLTVDM